MCMSPAHAIVSMPYEARREAAQGRRVFFPTGTDAAHTAEQDTR